LRPIAKKTIGISRRALLDHKMYVYGIGNVLEQTQQGGNERNELVRVTRP
jgi:hypothetical protein